jgi:hypothetical protein
MKRLSDAEMYTWKFIEENKSEVQGMSIRHVLEKTHVSMMCFLLFLQLESKKLLALLLKRIQKLLCLPVIIGVTSFKLVMTIFWLFKVS